LTLDEFSKGKPRERRRRRRRQTDSYNIQQLRRWAQARAVMLE